MAMVAIVFVSCEKAENLDGKIGLWEGMKYCSTQTSYWVIGIIATLICAFLLLVQYKAYQKEGTYNGWILFLAIALFLSAWLIGPEEVGRNTSVEQAKRGVYIR